MYVGGSHGGRTRGRDVLVTTSQLPGIVECRYWYPFYSRVRR
jgi:hypothetical protein